MPARRAPREGSRAEDDRLLAALAAIEAGAALDAAARATGLAFWRAKVALMQIGFELEEIDAAEGRTQDGGGG
jgi:hypothetical protein